MDSKLADDFDALYKAVGRSLSRWGQLEYALCNLYCACINPENSRPSNVAFWSIISFEGKLSATHAVMTARLANFPEPSPGHEALAEWNALKNGLTRKAKNRNKLAHGTVLQFNWRDSSTGEPETDILFAPYFFKGQATHIPSLEEMRRSDFDPRPKGRIYAKDIQQYEVGFKKAEDRLRRLKQNLRWLEPL